MALAGHAIHGINTANNLKDMNEIIALSLKWDDCNWNKMKGSS